MSDDKLCVVTKRSGVLSPFFPFLAILGWIPALFYTVGIEDWRFWFFFLLFVTTLVFTVAVAVYFWIKDPSKLRTETTTATFIKE